MRQVEDTLEENLFSTVISVLKHFRTYPVYGYFTKTGSMHGRGPRCGLHSLKQEWGENEVIGKLNLLQLYESQYFIDRIELNILKDLVTEDGNFMTRFPADLRH